MSLLPGMSLSLTMEKSLDVGEKLEKDSSHKPKCEIDCTNVKTRYVCGSNGITYTSKCALKQAKKCEGRVVRVAMKGKCKSKKNRVAKRPSKTFKPTWTAPSPRELVHSDFPLLQKSPGRTSDGEEVITHKSLQISDCIKDREFAIIADMENPSAAIFIPRCQENGLWTKGQCHTGTNYCWCVDENNGKPIPRSVTYNVDPKCDITDEMSIKGCSFHEKQTFLADLLKRIQNSFKKSGDGVDVQKLFQLDQKFHTKKQSIEWFFKVVDENENFILDRNEQKMMKAKLPKKKNYRKCSRNFLRYCDVNSDHKVTLNEWLKCADVEVMSNIPPKRTGKNPLFKYLSSD